MTCVHQRDVSVYIPVRNAGRTLAAAIDSVRRQTIAPHEFFLVVDARSTDASVEIARRSGLRIVEQSDGRLGHARNLALSACRTDWLASCDSDVTLEPGWLAALLSVTDDTVAAVGGCTEERLITPADRWRAVNLPHNWGPLGFDNPFMLVSEMLARVDAFRAIGGYRADLQSWEDSDACQRLRQAGFTLRYAPAAVAWHDRRDSVASVLELRWFYSSYRQRARLESLDGLIEKLAINRTYCLQSLSQTFHSPHAAVCAISLLLWPHHARRDLRAALERWPLLSELDRTACDECVAEALRAECVGRWPWMSTMFAANGTAARGRLALTPGFRRYADAVRQATRELLTAVPAKLDAALSSSFAGLDSTDRSPFLAPELGVDDEACDRLASATLRPAWNWPEIATLLSVDQNARVCVIGRALPSETPRGASLDPQSTAIGADALLIPHLEQFAMPLEELARALAAANVVAAAYQPPAEFIAGVRILTARDLATCAAGAGFQIVHFFTQAGLTRMIVRRAAVASATRRGYDAGRGTPRPTECAAAQRSVAV